MASIHAQRAKRWHTSPFMAEWLSNAVDYIRTPAGLQAYEIWLVQEFGPVLAAKMAAYPRQPASRRKPWLKDRELIFNEAAVELGVDMDALKSYHRFTGAKMIGTPPRTLPSIKRRRGESSIDWLTRRHEADTSGHKSPPLNLAWLRSIAISEYDKTKDTLEAWRSEPKMLFARIERRAQSTISHDWVYKLDPQKFQAVQMDYAFKSSMMKMSIAYMAWSETTRLFEDIARMGITTASSLERAYKKDYKLMWRLVGCTSRVYELLSQMRVVFIDSLTWCEAFRPLFNRYRKPEPDSQSIIQVKERYRYASASAQLSDLERVVVAHHEKPDILCFCRDIGKVMSEDPTELNKFSAEFFDELGDISIVEEFLYDFMHSDFGEGLKTHYLSLASDPQGLASLPDFLPTILRMNPNLIKPVNYWQRMSSPVGAFIRSETDLLRAVIYPTNIYSLTQAYVSGPSISPTAFMELFEKTWLEIDTAFYDGACRLDAPGAPGSVAKSFGFYSPKDPERPSLTKSLFRMFDTILSARNLKLEAATTPAPPRQAFKETIPVASPGDSTATSGHAYRTEAAKEAAPKKKKKKTRKATDSVSEIKEPQVVVEEVVESDEADRFDALPDVLPAEYKIGKKTLNIFHKILDLDEQTKDTADVAEKKGQVRWGDFERAMKRVGFEVYETAGSSVRFDPPARTARPITFHRPHPDSTLTPPLLKWIGARLRRCYGWTTATFQRETQPGPDA